VSALVGRDDGVAQAATKATVMRARRITRGYGSRAHVVFNLEARPVAREGSASKTAGTALPPRGRRRAAELGEL